MSTTFHARRGIVRLALLLAVAGAAVVQPWKAAAGDREADLPDHLAPRIALAAQPAVRKPQPTAELLVFVAPGQNAAQLAAQYGMRIRRRLLSDPNGYVFVTASTTNAARALPVLAADRRFAAAFPNAKSVYEPMAFTPNDPFFHKNHPAGFPGQWHLINETTPGLDARVQGAWSRGLTGSGVRIGIVDDSFQAAHPDLAPNFVAADSFDFGQGDANPDPVNAGDGHGISVAGVAAGRGGNGIGIAGAAPNAGLAGLRIDFPEQTVDMFVDATLFHSSGTNRSIQVKNHSYGIGAPFIDSPEQVEALRVSTLAGTIHCVAAGNERGLAGQDSNKKALQNSPDAISVAALGSSGLFATYSCFGANVFVTAPSSSNRTGEFRITTTDRLGEGLGFNGANDTFPDPDYTSRFGGTSSATPLVAGVMALVKQANPAVNTRFAKHLLARTSDIVDASDTTVESDGGWHTNAAGRHFNQNYGFGLVDASELTLKAPLFSGVTALQTQSTGSVSVGALVPDNSDAGISRHFTLTAPQPMEEMIVRLNIAHPSRGDLEAFLTSPQGTTGRLMIRSAADTSPNVAWTFTSNAFWGEIPAGSWTLNVRDRSAGNTGIWSSFAATARMGTLLAGISGTVINDLNGNGTTGVFEFEPRLANWRVFLDLNNNGILDGAEPSALTSSTGAYAFPNLPVGSYTLRLAMQGGFRATRPTSAVYSVNLNDGRAVRDFYVSRSVAISGRVWHDGNGDGRKQAAELFVGGVRVYLDGNNNGVLDAGEPSALSETAPQSPFPFPPSTAGFYQFTAPRPGTFVVRVANPKGTFVTFPAAGAHTVQLASGQTAIGRDFGIR